MYMIEFLIKLLYTTDKEKGTRTCKNNVYMT